MLHRSRQVHSLCRNERGDAISNHPPPMHAADTHVVRHDVDGTGRIANMNAAAVFISLLFWDWLWGIWGILLSIPIVVIAKVVTVHVEELQPVAELLGE